MASPLNLFLSLPTCIYQEVLQLQLQHVLDMCTAWPRPSKPLICGPASLLLQPCLPQSGCIWAPYHVLPRLTTLQHLPLPSEWKPTLKVLQGPTCLPLNSRTLSPPALPLTPTTWTISRTPQTLSPLGAAPHLGSLPYLLCVLAYCSPSQFALS